MALKHPTNLYPNPILKYLAYINAHVYENVHQIARLAFEILRQYCDEMIEKCNNVSVRTEAVVMWKFEMKGL